MHLHSSAQLTDRHEENINACLHAFGALLSAIGTFFLVKKSYDSSLESIFAALSFGGSTTLAFASSAFYHATDALKEPIKRAKRRVLDHAMIYVMIAGGYSPLFLVPLKAQNGVLICGTVWLMAIFGILWKLFFFSKSEALSIASYLFLGWFGVFFIQPLTENLDVHALWLIVCGGLVYCLGLIFYINDHRKYYHTLWHIAVLLGAGLHYIAIDQYIIQ